MTRILERNDTGPYRLEKNAIEGDAVYLCRCGLSRGQPFCDGSHKMTKDEPNVVLVRYVEDGGQRVRQIVDVEVVETV